MSYYNSRSRYLNRPAYAYRDAGIQQFQSAPMTPIRPSIVRNQHPMWLAYVAVQPARAAWIQANAPTSGFAGDMMARVVRFGDLTPNMGAAIDRAIARDTAPQSPVSAPQAASAEYPNIRAAFQRLIDAGHRGGRGGMITMGEVTLSLAPASGNNPGAVYVKRSGDYMGKIVGTRFVARHPTPALLADLAVIEADPVGAVTAHALLTARRLQAAQEAGTPISLPCGCCGLTLTDPVSIARGIGPICAGKWGF